MIRVEGRFADQTDAALLTVAARLRRAVHGVARQAQQDLRAQARAGGFRDGGRAIANAWRLELYPPAGRGQRSLGPAAVVRSKAPLLVEAFDRGAVIQAKRRKFLAIPTEVNRLRRRGAGNQRQVRVTPQEMIRSGQAFLRPLKGRPGSFLWCLKVEARTSKRGRLRLFAARYAEVYTGRVKGLQARRREVAERGFVVMFVLLNRVTLRKRLDFKAVVEKARAALRPAVATALGGRLAA